MAILKKISLVIIALIALAGIGYTATWFYIGSKIKSTVSLEKSDVLQNNPDLKVENVNVNLTGFPDKFIVTWSGNVSTNEGRLDIPELNIKRTWFGIDKTINLNAPHGFQINVENQEPIKIDHFNLNLTMPPNWPGYHAGKAGLAIWQSLNEQLMISNFNLASSSIGFDVSADGYMTLDRNLQPAGVIQLKFNDISYIEKKKLEIKEKIEQGAANLTDEEKKTILRQMATLAAFTSAQDMNYTIKILKNSVFISFLKLMQFPHVNWPEPNATMPAANVQAAPQASE